MVYISELLFQYLIDKFKKICANVSKNCFQFTRFTGKGGKNRRRGKNENETEKRELVFKEDGQEYAQVTKMLGNGRLEAMCFDGTKRLCHIRGKLRKKVNSIELIENFTKNGWVPGVD